MDGEQLRERYRALVADTSKDDWDDCGTPAIPSDAWDEAERFASSVMASVSGVRPAFPSPGDGGGVNLRWQGGRGEWLLDAQILPGGSVFWFQSVNGVRTKGFYSNRDRLIGHLNALKAGEI